MAFLASANLQVIANDLSYAWVSSATDHSGIREAAYNASLRSFLAGFTCPANPIRNFRLMMPVGRNGYSFRIVGMSYLANGRLTKMQDWTALKRR